MNLKIISIALFLFCLTNSACTQNNASLNTSEDLNTINTMKDEENHSDTEKASVISVSVSGNENNYNFSIGISSPDTGCDQYANWWEVITEDGSLLYRRILGHSHVNEQPFVRSGGSVPINENQTVYIRAHMNTSGYGTKVFKGSVANGFMQTTVSADFANNLATMNPLPTGCAF